MQQSRQALGYLENVLAQVKGGKSLDQFSGINSALDVISKPNKEYYRTFADYAFSQAKAAAVIKELEKTRQRSN